MAPPNADVQLGCGLVRSGRPWGVPLKEPPIRERAQEFILSAYDYGVRHFDTAPSYGESEALLGEIVTGLPMAVLATKYGETWSRDDGPVVDHSYDSAARSIETSLERLGRIDVLYVHRCTAEVLHVPDVDRILDLATRLGVRAMGVSVTDPKTATIAVQHGGFSYLQFPLNSTSSPLGSMVSTLPRSVTPVTNRPLAMGQLSDEIVGPGSVQAAFDYVGRALPRGVVLTGTLSSTHLGMNIEALSRACATDA